MSGNNKILPQDHQNLIENAGKPHKPYNKPRMTELGDLRTLTIGISPTGFEDSSGGRRTEYHLLSAPHFPQPDYLNQTDNTPTPDNPFLP
jgi:hypothetical protein